MKLLEGRGVYLHLLDEKPGTKHLRRRPEHGTHVARRASGLAGLAGGTIVSAIEQQILTPIGALDALYALVR